MNDDRSTNGDASESWSRGFEEALWLYSVQNYEEAEKLLRKLADETDSRDKKALCLLWVAQVNPALRFNFHGSAKALLELSKQVVWILYGGYRDRQQHPDRLLMRAFLLMAQAQFHLGDYKECVFALTQASGCMTAEDTHAMHDVMDCISLEIDHEHGQESLRKSRQDSWNCPNRHEGPIDCAKDETCPRPSIEDRESWLRDFWGCSFEHLPGNCREAKCCYRADYEKLESWHYLQPSWEVIEGR